MLPLKDKRFLLALALAIALHAAALAPFAGKIEVGGRSMIAEKPLILTFRVEPQTLDAKAANSGAGSVVATAINST